MNQRPPYDFVHMESTAKAVEDTPLPEIADRSLNAISKRFAEMREQNEMLSQQVKAREIENRDLCKRIVELERSLG